MSSDPAINKGNYQGRKRFRSPETSIKFIRKRNRNLGKEYVSTSRKNIPGKVFTNTCCNCKKTCSDKIIEIDRRIVFENFWKIGNFSAQNAFLCGLVKHNEIKRHRLRDETKGEKTTSNLYYVNIHNISHNVCKNYFLTTFQISNGRLQRALEHARFSSPGEDLRGKHSPANKTPQEKIQDIHDHINSFPAYQSHYTRSHNPNRRYLDPSLNIRLMYNLYKEKCADENNTPISESIYRNIFHRDFNLHFHVPAKDTCVTCDLFKAKLG